MTRASFWLIPSTLDFFGGMSTTRVSRDVRKTHASEYYNSRLDNGMLNDEELNRTPVRVTAVERKPHDTLSLARCSSTFEQHMRDCIWRERR